MVRDTGPAPRGSGGSGARRRGAPSPRGALGDARERSGGRGSGPGDPQGKAGGKRGPGGAGAPPGVGRDGTLRRGGPVPIRGARRDPLAGSRPSAALPRLAKNLLGHPCGAGAGSAG